MTKKTVSGIMLTLLLIGMLTLAFNIQPIRSDPTEDWPMFRHDLRHTGFSPSKTPDSNNTLWSFMVESSIALSPVVANGKVYVQEGNGMLYALNEFTGQLIWSYKIGPQGSESPAVANGRIFVGSFGIGGGTLYALNETNGALIWTYQTGGMIWASPTIVNGKVIVGSADGKIYALNETAGALLWTYTTGGQVWSSAAVANGVVFVGSDDYNVYALNETNGQLKWSYTTGNEVMSSPTVVDGLVFVGTKWEGKLYALNETDGTLVWRYQLDGSSTFTSPAVAYDKVFTGDEGYTGGYVYAISKTSGTLIWKYQTGGNIVSSPAIADGKVFIGSEDGKLYAFNATNGEVIWTCQPAYPHWDFSSSPAIADGLIFTGSTVWVGNARLYAFGAPPPQTCALIITATVGGTTDPAPGTYSYTANSTVQVTAIPAANYLLDYWELDGVNVGSANPYPLLMDENHTLKAFFSPVPPPLSASISPLSASILVGQSVTFTSTVSGGYTPYSHQWYLNGNPVSGANATSWTFTPTISGIYYVHLKVTDAKGNTAQSDTARIAVTAVPVGGYSIPIPGQTTATPLTPYLILTAILTIAYTTIKHKTTKKTKKPP